MLAPDLIEIFATIFKIILALGMVAGLTVVIVTAIAIVTTTKHKPDDDQQASQASTPRSISVNRVRGSV